MMRGDLIETFKIMEILIMADIFLNISPQTGNSLSRQIWKNKSTNQLDFLAISVIYFWNKLPNQIKNSNTVENVKIKLDDIKKMLRKSI